MEARTHDLVVERGAASGALGPKTLLTLDELGLMDVITESRSLLDLQDDWDGLGSPGYGVATWNSAVDLLVDIASQLRDRYGILLQSAEVLPGSRGNIDLELCTTNRRLLISVPADSLARYYGHDQAERNTTKGTFDLSMSNRWLVAWFAE